MSSTLYLHSKSCQETLDHSGTCLPQSMGMLLPCVLELECALDIDPGGPAEGFSESAHKLEEHLQEHDHRS